MWQNIDLGDKEIVAKYWLGRTRVCREIPVCEIVRLWQNTGLGDRVCGQISVSENEGLWRNTSLRDCETVAKYRPGRSRLWQNTGLGDRVCGQISVSENERLWCVVADEDKLVFRV